MNTDKKCYQIGDWVLDVNALTLSRDSHCEKLPGKAIDLLAVLAQAGGEIVSAQAITEQVWQGNEYTAKRGIINNISKLRGAFGSGVYDEYIENIPKRGYRLTVPVKVVQAQSDEQKTPKKVVEKTPEPQLPPPKRKPYLAAGGLLLVALVIFMLFENVQLSTMAAGDIPLQAQVTKLEKFQALTGQEYHPRVDDTGTKLIFTRETPGTSNVFLTRIGADDNKPVQLSDRLQYNTSPVFVGKNEIAYLHADGLTYCEVIIHSLVSGVERKLADCAVAQVALSYNSFTHQLAYKGTRSPRGMVFVDLETDKVAADLCPKPCFEFYRSVIFAKHLDDYVIHKSTSGGQALLTKRDGTVLLTKSRSISGVSYLFDDQFLVYGVGDARSGITTYLLDINSGEEYAVDMADINFSHPNVDGNNQIYFSDTQQEDKLFKVTIDGTSRVMPVEQLRELDSVSSPTYHAATDSLLFFTRAKNDAKINLVLTDSRFNHLRTLKTQGLVEGGHSMAVCNESCNKVIYSNFARGVGATVYLYDLEQDVEYEVYQSKGFVQPQYWTDQSGIVMAVNSGQRKMAGLYQFSPDDAVSPLKKLFGGNIVKAVFDQNKRRIFFVVRGVKGIWQYDMDTQDNSKLLEDFSIRDGNNFTLFENKLVYLSRTLTTDDIVVFDLQNNSKQIVYQAPLSSINSGGFAWLPHASALMFGTTDTFSDIWQMTLKQP